MLMQEKTRNYVFFSNPESNFQGRLSSGKAIHSCVDGVDLQGSGIALMASPWLFGEDDELESPPTSLFLFVAWIKHQTLFPSSEIFLLVRSMGEGCSGSLKRVPKPCGSNVANHKQLFHSNS